MYEDLDIEDLDIELKVNLKEREKRQSWTLFVIEVSDIQENSSSIENYRFSVISRNESRISRLISNK